MSDFIRIDRPEPGCARVTIDRPQKRNALNEEGWRGIGDAFEQLSVDLSIRVIILTGVPGVFCAGDDILAFAAVRDDPAARQRYWDTIMRAYAMVSAAKVPVIAAIDGPSIGGGCTLALRADFRIAGPGAVFSVPPARLGLVYPADSTALLVNAVGAGLAKYMLFTGNTVDAKHAVASGLALAASSQGAVASALELAREMSASAPLSIQAAKIAVDGIAMGRLAEVTPEVRRLSDLADASEDYREGTAAFATKRRPIFQGK
ncbi:enoyl-CoA hydratase/isomerase family protein [Limoniibacter endophyticus]|uniref:Putative enoyl-CoA hydratase echA6 n=1 Tax=Limoniibacter endophyticus TaxID=1565040 RepID=A0A8J3GHF5_9HYPH|nr:enoyl-CoA hydratase/isomerase family protein [Limoniibacter endophyticus]GHC78861.1 putative enoyl-CoA hydratase echA6 [Limoniibacter endophyticus]